MLFSCFFLRTTSETCHTKSVGNINVKIFLIFKQISIHPIRMLGKRVYDQTLMVRVIYFITKFGKRQCE